MHAIRNINCSVISLFAIAARNPPTNTERTLYRLRRRNCMFISGVNGLSVGQRDLTRALYPLTSEVSDFLSEAWTQRTLLLNATSLADYRPMDCTEILMFDRLKWPNKTDLISAARGISLPPGTMNLTYWHKIETFWLETFLAVISETILRLLAFVQFDFISGVSPKIGNLLLMLTVHQPIVQIISPPSCDMKTRECPI